MSASGTGAFRNSPAASGLLCLLVAGLTLLVALLWRLGTLENHDVSWLVIAAGRMLHGGRYARDFFEVNMPLAIAAYIPPILIATALNLPQAPVIDGTVLALVAQSGVLCFALLRNPAARSATTVRSALIVCWMLFLLCFQPGYDFGQREHLIAILTLPFVFMMLGRERPRATGLRIYVSLLAAIGSVIKPQYALLPWLLLGLLAWRRRSWQPMLGLEARLLAGVTAIVLAISLLLYPDWLTCARWAEDLYASFSHDVWSRMLALNGMGVLACCLAFQFVVGFVNEEMSMAVLPLAVASAYSLCVAVLQAKGWQYHLLPALLFAFVGQGVALAVAVSGMEVRRGRAMKASALVAAGIIIASATSAVAAVRSTPTVGSLGLIPQALRSIATEGDPVYAFTVELPPMLPAVPMLKLQWASRYSSLWPLPALLRAERAAGTPEADRLLASYRGPFIASVREDFERFKPRIVFVDRHRLPDSPAGYDLMSFFVSDPGFAAIWRHYARIGSVTYPATVFGYDIYVRSDDAAGTSAHSSGSYPRFGASHRSASACVQPLRCA